MRRKLLDGWAHPGWLNYALLPVSAVYAGLVRFRTLLYRSGVLRIRKLEAKVIVVGALAAGGTGKTPLVIALGNRLKRTGYKPGVILRGYRAGARHFPRAVCRTSTVREVGDEACLISESTGLPVVIGPNRYDSGRMLIAEHGCNIILSDDGFQHLALHRDLDIVVLDSSMPFGNGWCLPSGPLREPVPGLKRADLVVQNARQQRDESAAGRFGMSMELGPARNLGNGSRAPLGNFLGMPVHAVAAVGNPERFFAQLEESGLQIIRHPFPDHHFFRAADLAFDNSYPVLMTEKDGVKCRTLPDAGRFWAVEAMAVPDAAFDERVDRFLAGVP